MDQIEKLKKQQTDCIQHRIKAKVATLVKKSKELKRFHRENSKMEKKASRKSMDDRDSAGSVSDVDVLDMRLLVNGEHTNYFEAIRGQKKQF